MGQAQLLLIVLGTVVVGLAVMAGINAYEQNNIKSDLDAVVHECLRLASDAQTAAQKPEAFGGLWDTGDAGETGNGHDFADSAAGATDLQAIGWTANGASSLIAITAVGASQFDATCTSLKFPDGGDGNANIATINITGVSADDIATTTTLYDPDFTATP
ncbi:MAG: hypothetical protein HKN13_09065 [Rhodothermales bacterium]|nr:hypothetical protein [Rhodothermales bacterium]